MGAALGRCDASLGIVKESVVRTLFWHLCRKRTETPFWRHSSTVQFGRHYGVVPTPETLFQAFKRMSFRHHFGAVQAPFHADKTAWRCWNDDSSGNAICKSRCRAILSCRHCAAADDVGRLLRRCG
uniref:Uncharacterized protein n=1 Tax=Vitis vinifera TaxID=29760 RepID=A5AU77_VITVI|nr:hypothetical protein VITISV_001400 [Vitis vinifera]